MVLLKLSDKLFMRGMIHMRKNKVFLTVNQLEPGMIIAEDFIQENIILVHSDVVLTEIIISKLREKYFLDKVLVYRDDEADVNQSKDPKEKTVEDIDQSFNEFSFNVGGIFHSMYNEGICDIEGIRGFSKKIQGELKSTSAVIKNIVLYGSGNDVIYRHSVNVAALSSILGRWIGLDENTINLLTYSAILHDYGKTKVDKDILNKVNPLTKNEIKEIKGHPVIGYNEIKKVQFLDNSVGYGVLMHHERLDGSGYPLGIKEDKIHPFAKIIAIADVFDAVNSNRVHKKSRGPFEALEIIQKESLGKLDYKYCKIFLEHIVNYYMGENVLLNTNKVCKIEQININDISRPLLFDGSVFIDLKQEKELNVEELVL